MASIIPLNDRLVRRNRVVDDYSHLVRPIAVAIWKRLPRWVDLQEIIQTGMLGLWKAADKFTEKRAESFEQYAQTRIRGAIIDEIRSRVKTAQREISIGALSGENGNEDDFAGRDDRPSPEDLAIDE